MSLRWVKKGQTICGISGGVYPRCNGRGKPVIIALWNFPGPMSEED
jgi:hypothetical protein